MVVSSNLAPGRTAVHLDAVKYPSNIRNNSVKTSNLSSIVNYRVPQTFRFQSGGLLMGGLSWYFIHQVFSRNLLPRKGFKLQRIVTMAISHACLASGVIMSPTTSERNPIWENLLVFVEFGGYLPDTLLSLVTGQLKSDIITHHVLALLVRLRLGWPMNVPWRVFLPWLAFHSVGDCLHKCAYLMTTLFPKSKMYHMFWKLTNAYALIVWVWFLKNTAPLASQALKGSQWSELITVSSIMSIGLLWLHWSSRALLR